MKTPSRTLSAFVLAVALSGCAGMSDADRSTLIQLGIFMGKQLATIGLDAIRDALGNKIPAGDITPSGPK